MAEAQAERLKIVVVSEVEHLNECLINHVIELAERLKREIVAVLATPSPDRYPQTAIEADAQLLPAAPQASLNGIERFKASADHKGIPFRFLVRQGRVESIVALLSSEIRRIDFVIVPRRADSRNILPQMSVPVFSVLC